MIIVYPMLTEPGISKNIIPAICKVLERFVIVYRMDEIFKWTGNTPHGSVKVGAVGIQLQLRNEIIDEANNYGRPDKNKEKDEVKGTKPSNAPEINIKSSGSQSKADAKIVAPNQSELMLEPTYVTLNTRSGPRMVGVKVLPFPVKNGNIIELMTKDIKLTGSNLTFQKWTRMFKRAFKFKRRPTVSGDVFNDVVMASTSHRSNIFLLINHAEMDTEYDYTAAQIHKLHKLGWSSFAFADDVNKRSMFCMKEFSGMCTTMPYSYMMTSFSKDLNKSFDDLEDARRSSAPFFSRKNTKLTTIVGEKVAQSKLQNSEIVNEGILDFIKNAGSKLGKIAHDLSSAVKTKNDSSIDNVLKTVPDVSISTVNKMSQKEFPDFKQSYNFALKVVNNSLTNVDPEIAEGIATGVALNASSKDGDVNQNTRDELKRWLPSILRSSATGLKTLGWAILTLILADKIGIGNKTKVAILLIVLGRGIYKLSKEEQKDLDKERKAEKNKTDTNID